MIFVIKKSNIHCYKNPAKAMRTANFFFLLKSLKNMFYLLMSDSKKNNAVTKQHKNQVYFSKKVTLPII